METEIKRVNFFDGQFLQEGEFQVEQQYHLHMRRRLNFMLFETPGVILGLEPGNDDLQFDVIDHVARTFRVKPGTAVALVSDTKEGKEIILRAPSGQVTFGVGIGATAPGFVVLKQMEERTMIPPSLGGVPDDTRVEEIYEITVEAAWPPGPLPADFEEYVFLGTLTFNSTTNQLEADYGNRQEAKLRASLVGASPVAATVTDITPSSAQDGTTVNATITGTNLAGATAVNFSGSGITTNITGGTATTVDVDITIASGAAAGPRTFTVTTPQGVADSTGVPGAAFSVSTPTPVIVTSTQPPTLANLQPNPPPGNLIVLGSNIRDASLSNGDPATGTVVRFVDPASPSTVLAICPNPIVLSNVGATQRVQVDLPLEGDLPTGTTTVRVQVSFGGGTGEAPGTLTVF